MIATGYSLDDLTTSLRAATVTDVKRREIEQIMTSLDIDRLDLTPFLYFEPGRYTRNLVYRDERFEILILCWSAGSRSSIHDHGGNACFMSLQQGTLVIDDYAVRAGGKQPGSARLTAVSSRIMRSGDLDIRSATNDVHRVSAPVESAVSLHVYAKALDRCLIFDDTLASCKSVASRYDTIRLIAPSRTVPL